ARPLAEEPHCRNSAVTEQSPSARGIHARPISVATITAPARHSTKLAVNLVWDTAVLAGVPALFGLPLADSVFALGDFAYLIGGSAAVALVWGPSRTLLAWRALHATASPSAGGSPKRSAAVSLGNA